jgi:hypothetical protein
MPIEFDNDTARLQDIVAVHEAEGLYEWLLGQSSPKVDLSGCKHLHTACLQLLMLFRPKIVAMPEDEDLKKALLMSTEA